MTPGSKFLGGLGNLFSELGLASMADQDAGAVAITGGTIANVAGSFTSLAASLNVTAAGYVQSNRAGAQFVAPGYMHYSDGSNFYVLLTGSGTPSTSFNGLRPFFINLSTGKVGMSNGAAITGGLSVDNLTVSGSAAAGNVIQVTGPTAPTLRTFNTAAPGPSGGTAGRYSEEYVDANGQYVLRFVNGAYTSGPTVFTVTSDVNSNPLALNWYGTSAALNMPVTVGALTGTTANFSGALTVGGSTTSGQVFSQGASAALTAYDRGGNANGTGTFYRTGSISRLWDSNYGDHIQYGNGAITLVYGTTVSGALNVSGTAAFSGSVLANGIAPYTAISSSNEWHPFSTNVTYGSAAPNGATSGFVYQFVNTVGVGVTVLDSKGAYQTPWSYSFATATLTVPTLAAGATSASSLNVSGNATIGNQLSIGNATSGFLTLIGPGGTISSNGNQINGTGGLYLNYTGSSVVDINYGGGTTNIHNTLNALGTLNASAIINTSSGGNTTGISVPTTNSNYTGNRTAIYNDGNSHIEAYTGTTGNGNQLWINQNTNAPVNIGGGGGLTSIQGPFAATGASATITSAGQATRSLNTGSVGGALLIKDTGTSPLNGGAVYFAAGSGTFGAIKGYLYDGGGNTGGGVGIQVRGNSSSGTLTEALLIEGTQVTAPNQINLGGYLQTLNGATLGSYGSMSLAGSKGGYSGIHFNDAGTRTFMVQNSAGGLSGIWNSGGWEWYFTGGTLTQGTVPAANVGAGALANGMTATTQAGSDNSTKIATTAAVNAIIAALGAGTLGTTGSVPIPGTGLIVKWTQATFASGKYTWTFAAAFPTACVFAIANPISTTAGTVSAWATAAPTASAANFAAVNTGAAGAQAGYVNGALFLAIGY